MNKYFYTLATFFVFGFISAQKENKIVTIDLTKAIDKPEQIVLLSEIETDIQYIPIETKDKCLYSI